MIVTYEAGFGEAVLSRGPRKVYEGVFGWLIGDWCLDDTEAIHYLLTGELP